MFPGSEANFFSEKKIDSRAIAAIKPQRRLCRILLGEDLVAAGGMELRHYNADGGGGWDRRSRTS